MSESTRTRSTLTQRALRLGDAAAITEILEEMERAEPSDEAYSEADIVEELTTPGVDLERGSIGIIDGDRLVAFGYLFVSPPAPEWKASETGGVRPEYTDLGLGRRVIDSLMICAAVMRDADSPGRPGQLKIWVPASRPRTAALFEAAGFHTWRYFSRMRRDLKMPVTEAQAPPGVEIRPYRPADDDAVLLASNESFADHWGSTPMDTARWRAEYAESSSFRPANSFVALVDGEVVSFVLTAEYDAETVQRGYRSGYIARVGTVRSARGRGIASALIDRTLDALVTAGYRFAELGVDADSPTGAGRLYQRAGFDTVERNVIVGRHF